MPPRGLQLHQESATHYDVLGLAPFECDVTVIEAKARERMREIRKYQVGPYAAEATRSLDLLAAARACLLNPQLKRDYDEQLRVLFDLPQGTIRSTYLPPPADPEMETAISARALRHRRYVWTAVIAVAVLWGAWRLLQN